jgi:hypothetical protein
MTTTELYIPVKIKNKTLADIDLAFTRKALFRIKAILTNDFYSKDQQLEVVLEWVNHALRISNPVEGLDAPEGD